MLYIFDRDGTLSITRSGKPCPNDLGDQELLPMVEMDLRELSRNIDTRIAVASNQGGVSIGHMSQFMAWATFLELEQMLQVELFEVAISCFHQRGRYSQYFADQNKPKPNLVRYLLDRAGALAKEAIFVGNEFADEEAARRAGVKFCWAHKFFKWSPHFVVRTQAGYYPKEWLDKWHRYKEGVLCF